MKTMLILSVLILGLIAAPPSTMSVSMSVVTVTAYSYSGGATPHGITASGKKVHEGMIALSRDVEKMMNLNFGDRVLLHGLGVFEFQDRMASRWRYKADVFMQSDHSARRFGVRRHVILVKLV